jgi:class 3 adenylate cyclase
MRAFDWVLLGAMLTLFGVSLVLHLRAVERTGLAGAGIVVTAAPAPDAYPRIARPMPGMPGAALPVGAQVLRLGEIDCRGLGEIQFVAASLEAMRDGRLEVVLDAGSGPESHTIELPTPLLAWWWYLPTPLAFALLGVISIFRVADRRLARLALAGAILFASVWLRFYGGPRAYTYLWAACYAVELTLALPLCLRVMLLFPSETARDGWLARLGPWLLGLQGPAVIGATFNWPLRVPVAFPLMLTISGATLITGLAVLADSYQRASPVVRRQIKWVLLGGYLSGVTALGAWALSLFTHERWLLFDMSSLSGVFFAGGYIVAILRFQLVDVDRVIGATATYTVLSVLGLAALLSCVPPVAQAASESIGIAPVTAQTALSFGLALLIVPGYRMLQPRIERAMFAERAALEEGIAGLLLEIGGEREAGVLFEHLGARLLALIGPESLAIYGRTDAAFVSLVAHGRATPPAFDARGPLIATLAQSGRPLTAERLTRAAAPSAFELAALHSFDADVLLPISTHGELSAFVCLGPKRSGDIYTAGECALLGAVADRIGVALAQFDSAEVMRQKLELYQSLRRYVPGSLAERLERGQSLDAGEREVSVLFVDIRGYTSLAAERRADEVFSLVSHYTRAVGEVVQRHGGTIVEFNGDGMMAVFGAPEALAEKERAAVEAALALVRELRRAGSTDGSAPPLQVGVGIATGSAYVGSIQSVDRAIWSAIGSTTNLAARLEQLTRELDAVIAVDHATHFAAGESAKDFSALAGVRIRGREKPEDIFVLRRA